MPLGLEVIFSIVIAVMVTRSYLSRQTPQTAGNWALAAVILGFVSWSALLLHRHNAGGTIALWSLGGFAACELVGLWAGLQALSTRVGRWALAACTWPFVVLAVEALVHSVKG